MVGLTSGYALRRLGHEVTIVERRDASGLETSFANGALLSPSMPDPWNSPGCWRTLLGSLVRADSPLKVHARTLPSLGSWGLRFLWASRRSAFERSALANLQLALYSSSVAQDMRRQVDLESGVKAVGSLRVFRDRASFDVAIEVARKRASYGLGFRTLSPADTVDLQPALAPLVGELVGAIYCETDQVGDCYEFCRGLEDRAKRAGVKFRFASSIDRIEVSGGIARTVVGREERLVADQFVIAAGSFSSQLLKTAGIHIPVRPAKGYSVSIVNPGLDPMLSIPVIDDDFHAVIVPLCGGIRVAGTAEFVGYDRSLSAARIGGLLRLLRSVLPNLRFDSGQARPWCGLRAMSADGVPLIGRTTVSNLSLNTGHGHLGWTMAAGAAALLADVISGTRSEIGEQSFAPTRFG